MGKYFTYILHEMLLCILAELDIKLGEKIIKMQNFFVQKVWSQ